MIFFIALSATACQQAPEKARKIPAGKKTVDKQKPAAKSQPAKSQPAKFGPAKFATADRVPDSTTALVEISDVGPILTYLQNAIKRADPETSQQLDAQIESIQALLGIDPFQADEYQQLGFDLSKPIGASLLHLMWENNPQQNVVVPYGFGIHIALSDSQKALENIRKWVTAAKLTVSEKTGSDPAIFSINGKGFSGEMKEVAAFTIDKQNLTLVIPPSMDSASGYLQKTVQRTKNRPLSQASHFQRTLENLSADNQVRLFVNLKSIAAFTDEHRSFESPPLLKDFVGVGVTANQERIDVALQLANQSGIKEFLQPGSSCQELMATADKPLVAFSLSLDKPVELFAYLVQQMETPSTIGFGDFKKEIAENLGTSFEQLSKLVSQGSAAVLVYPGVGQPMNMGFMVLIKTNDRKRTEEWAHNLMDLTGFTPRKYGQNIVWQNRQERGSTETLALVDNFVVFGNAVTQIHNLARKEGDGWKPVSGGTDLVAAEASIMSLIQWMMAQGELPTEFQLNAGRLFQKWLGQGILIRLKTNLQKDTLVTSVNSGSLQWGSALATLVEPIILEELSGLQQPKLDIPPLHSVGGHITIDGKSLAGARVALHSVDGGVSRVFAATTDQQGNYEIQGHYSTGSFPGAPSGRYKVTVIKVAPSQLSDEEFERQYRKTVEAAKELTEKTYAALEPDILVNKQYVDQSTTPFSINVREGENRFDFDLKTQSVKVGVLHSLSGVMAIFETATKEAVLLAVEEINAQGGLLGKRIEPVVVNPASDWSLFAEKARGLVEIEKVAATFGCWTSVSRKSVLPVYEKNNALLFYPVQFEGEEQSLNVFYTGATPNLQLVPATKYMMSEKGGTRKKFYLLGTDYVYPRTANKVLKAYLKSQGIPDKNIGEEYTPFHHLDYRVIVSRIKEFAANGDACVISTITGDSNVPFYREFARQELTPSDCPIIAFSVAEDELRAMDVPPLVGHLACQNYFQSIDTPENKRFVKAFKAKFGNDRVTDDPIEAAYFGVYLWAKAVEKAGSFDVDKVRIAMQGLEFDSPGGRKKVHPTNHHMLKPVYLGKILENGQFEIIHVTDGLVSPDSYSRYLHPDNQFPAPTGGPRR